MCKGHINLQDLQQPGKHLLLLVPRGCNAPVACACIVQTRLIYLLIKILLLGKLKLLIVLMNPYDKICTEITLKSRLLRFPGARQNYVVRQEQFFIGGLIPKSYRILPIDPSMVATEKLIAATTTDQRSRRIPKVPLNSETVMYM